MKKLVNIDKTPHTLKPEYLEKWNFLLENNNFEIFFREMYFLIEKSKANYIKAKDKEIYLENALYNLIYILNNLNIKRVYNSSSIIDFKQIDKIEDLKDMFRIRGKKIEQGKKGTNCHIITAFIKYFIDQVTNNNKNIKIYFDLNKSNNHGRILIKIKNYYIVIESSDKNINIFKIKSKTNPQYKFYTHMPHYLNNAKRNVLEGNRLVYQYKNYKIHFVKKGIFNIIFFQTKSPKTEIPYGFRRLYKKYYKLKNIKLIYKSGKFSNIEELKSEFGKKFGKIVELMLDNVNRQKLEQFL